MCHNVAFVCEYVTFVPRVQQMFKFTYKFILTFMSILVLEVIAWVPFLQEVKILYAVYPDLNL